MPLLRCSAFPRHQKRERWGINSDQTNVTYEWNHWKDELQQKNRLGTDSRKDTGRLKLVHSRETPLLILMQHQLTNICSVHIGVLYFISEKSLRSIYNKSNCNETMQKGWMRIWSQNPRIPQTGPRCVRPQIAESFSMTAKLRASFIYAGSGEKNNIYILTDIYIYIYTRIYQSNENFSW